MLVRECRYLDFTLYPLKVQAYLLLHFRINVTSEVGDPSGNPEPQTTLRDCSSILLISAAAGGERETLPLLPCPRASISNISHLAHYPIFTFHCLRGSTEHTDWRLENNTFSSLLNSLNWNAGTYNFK